MLTRKPPENSATLKRKQPQLHAAPNEIPLPPDQTTFLFSLTSHCLFTTLSPSHPLTLNHSHDAPQLCHSGRSASDSAFRRPTFHCLSLPNPIYPRHLKPYPRKYRK